MSPIHQRFPDFPTHAFVRLTRVLVEERDAVASINKVYENCGVGLGVLAAQAARNRLMVIAHEGQFPGLEFERAAGLAYVLKLHGVPFRVQPDCPEIRDVLPAERDALKKLPCDEVQVGLFTELPSLEEVLRLEISQRPGQKTARVSLYFVNADTGAVLDSMILYDSQTGYMSVASSMERPAQTPNLSNVVKLKFPKQAKSSDLNET